MPNLDNVQSAHFFGVGGIGVSAIARMLLSRDVSVSGSDLAASRVTRELEELGMTFHEGQDISHVPAQVDLIIYTVALENYAPDLLNKLRETFPGKLASYPEVRAELSRRYKTIAIAGTHGKTTTTAMLAKIMIDAGLDPTVIVGSLMREYGSNYVQGQSEYLLVEADEYKKNFLSISPYIIGITNVELDHVDCYRDLADLEGTFRQFVTKLPKGGALITSAATKGQLGTPAENYDALPDPDLRFPTAYNLANAKLALTIALRLGVDEAAARQSLADFAGTWRRFEYLGAYRGADVYDDYAHHPTELSALLSGVAEVFPNKKVTLIFQPHTYSRTTALFDNFVKSFAEAKTLQNLVLMPIYPAREQPDGTTSQMLGDAIQAAAPGLNVRATTGHDDTLDYLASLGITPDSLILTVGAGETNLVGEEISRI